jgi:hypothetical protein
MASLEVFAVEPGNRRACLVSLHLHETEATTLATENIASQTERTDCAEFRE